MADQFIIKIAPQLTIKNFFRNLGFVVRSLSHPATANFGYTIKIAEPRNLAHLTRLSRPFTATVNLNNRVITVGFNKALYLENAKMIVTNIDSLMKELGIENNQWTISVVER
jgi:hypothetical protein